MADNSSFYLGVGPSASISKCDVRLAADRLAEGLYAQVFKVWMTVEGDRIESFRDVTDDLTPDDAKVRRVARAICTPYSCATREGACDVCRRAARAAIAAIEAKK